MVEVPPQEPLQNPVPEHQKKSRLLIALILLLIIVIGGATAGYVWRTETVRLLNRVLSADRSVLPLAEDTGQLFTSFTQLEPLAELLLNADPILASSARNLPADITATLSDANLLLRFYTHEGYTWDMHWLVSPTAGTGIDSVFFWGLDFLGKPEFALSDDQTIRQHEHFIDAAGMAWVVRRIDGDTVQLRQRGGNESDVTVSAGQQISGTEFRVVYVGAEEITLSRNPYLESPLGEDGRLNLAPLFDAEPAIVVEHEGHRWRFGLASYLTLLSDLQITEGTPVYRVMVPDPDPGAALDDEFLIVPLSDTLLLSVERSVSRNGSQSNDNGIKIYTRVPAPTPTPIPTPPSTAGWVSFTNKHGLRFQHPPTTTVGSNSFGVVDARQADAFSINNLAVQNISAVFAGEPGRCAGISGPTVTLRQYAENVWRLNKEDDNPNVTGKTVGALESVTIGNQPAFQFTVTGSTQDACGGLLLPREYRLIFTEYNGQLFEIRMPTNDQILDQILNTFSFTATP